ncbi:SelT/SelW/SelH family protein [Natronobacterium gregoryi]|uniref:Selenoprotein W-related protein n=2 Tax=Natronobacterium gregoryi TaxID=44930 RepID=A0A1I3TAM5_9EURY|nr:Rdx family protein [Natronobacterium gregoryi]AFZ71490.1 selT/selW/selH selenoprotein domain protein [Natronobacterium gregoryi SP2]ELY66793.1 putative selenoprotein [Natronobacterium gregoryi SP2]PLK18695.1 SelT/SelW/SelH family protein [Natronobacterium gregoryi SP2]SFJ68238.1 selenoprotein W-related protein [Natronobacterium gregoryi]
MVTVEIEYCVPCGFLSRAQDVQHALLSTFGEELEAVTLRTGTDGVFVVRVGDEVVFDKAEDEFDVDGIVRQVRTHL